MKFERKVSEIEIGRLPRPSEDPSATSLRVRRCLFPSLVAACRWHDISKMAAARAAPAREAGTRGPRLPALLGRRPNPAQLNGPSFSLLWLDRDKGLPPCKVNGMPEKTGIHEHKTSRWQINSLQTLKASHINIKLKKISTKAALVAENERLLLREKILLIKIRIIVTMAKKKKQSFETRKQQYESD